MRRFLAALLALLLLAAPASAEWFPAVVIDNIRLDLPMDQLPFIEDGRTLVPIRAISEGLGAEVDWDDAARKVTVRRGEVQLELTIDESTAYVNGSAVPLDQPAMLVGQRTFVPLRFIAEAFGLTVEWLQDSVTVAITTRPRPVPSEPFAATPAAGELKQVKLTKGESLTPEGDSIWLLNVKTGAVEGWMVPGAARDSVGYIASPDGRFIIARSKDTGWVVDRTTGSIQKWDRYQYDLVTASAAHLLFQEVRAMPGATANGFANADGRWDGHLFGESRYTVVAPDLKPVASFTLPAGRGELTRGEQALFSPTGDKLMISREDHSYLVALPSGEVSDLFYGPGRFQPVNGGAAAIAILGHPRGYQIRRYDWEGKALAEAMVEARHIQVSNDGEWVAWEVVRDDFTPAVYYAPLAAAHNPYQALGATMCYGLIGRTGARWMPDGNGGQSLIVRTKDGMRALGTDGTVQQPPALGEDWYAARIPAPGTGPLLGIRSAWEGGEVMGAMAPGGELLAHVSVTGRDGLAPYKADALWGATADELRFTVRQHWGTGGPCGDYTIPLGLKVSQPGSFDWNLTLEVFGTGSCLNVRSAPSLTAGVITCLEDGARILLGNNSNWETLPDFHYNSDGQWFQIRTASGEPGWIMVSSGFVRYAD